MAPHRLGRFPICDEEGAAGLLARQDQHRHGKPRAAHLREVQGVALEISEVLEQARLVASDIRGQVVAGAGHWLMEEAPNTVIPAITDFVG